MLRVVSPPGCRLRLRVVPRGAGFCVGAEIVPVPSVDPSGVLCGRVGACVHATLRTHAAQKETSVGAAMSTNVKATRLDSAVAGGVMGSDECTAEPSVGVGGSTPPLRPPPSLIVQTRTRAEAAEYDGAHEGALHEDEDDLELNRTTVPTRSPPTPTRRGGGDRRGAVSATAWRHFNVAGGADARRGAAVRQGRTLRSRARVS